MISQAGEGPSLSTIALELGAGWSSSGRNAAQRSRVPNGLAHGQRAVVSSPRRELALSAGLWHTDRAFNGLRPIRLRSEVAQTLATERFDSDYGSSLATNSGREADCFAIWPAALQH